MLYPTTSNPTLSEIALKFNVTWREALAAARLAHAPVADGRVFVGTGYYARIAAELTRC